MHNKRIAIIPARGGSKRIPKKNIKEFCGQPIIAYSIKVALECDLFDHVIVSTDNEEIAEVAKKYGAEVPFERPAFLSDDLTGTDAVIKHALIWFNENKGKVDYACCLSATAPFMQTKYILKGWEVLLEKKVEFVFSVTSFPFSVFRSLKINSDDTVEMYYPEYYDTRSQDLPEAYHDAGQFYWGQTDAFINDLSVFSDHSIPVILPRYLVQDIDTCEDWLNAELMYKAFMGQHTKEVDNGNEFASKNNS